MWEQIYDKSGTDSPALYRYWYCGRHIEVHFNLHIGSRKVLNWFCTDHTGNQYLHGTNKKGYKTLEEAQRAGERGARRKDFLN